MERYVGLMSGTSADGIDAVVARFEQGRFLGLDGTHHQPHAPALRETLIQLGRNHGAALPLADLAQLDVALAEQFATATLALLSATGLATKDIRAIGSHGQTVFHDPAQARSSLQLGDPNRIAAEAGIPVVADFRRMDIALGGQGAPLVPAFHEAVFRGATATAVINIGGIANITALPATGCGAATGYDCGPGNALMDEWTLHHLGTAYDADGLFAASGQVLAPLLNRWLETPYFHAVPPKSTGRAQFNLDWAAQCGGGLTQHAPADVQASLCELTARSIAACVPAGTARVLICGGGAFNKHLMGRLGALLPRAEVTPTDTAGLPAQWVEAAAFAWLAHQRLHQRPGNLTSVTGASRPAVLGGLYG